MSYPTSKALLVPCFWLLWLHMLRTTSAFLADPSPCTYTSFYIRCDSKGLSSVPTFKSFNTNTSVLSIYLSNNQITTIPGNAFANIRTANAARIELIMDNNKITTISADAFKGLETSIKYLDLSNNNLTRLPYVIEKLTSLENLNINGNQINVINPTVFARIGHSLISLQIDLNLFTAVPTELHFLRKLTHLTLDKIPFARINEGAFSSFETTLTTLDITGSNLENLPTVICRLTHLHNFNFQHNTGLKEPIIQPCTMPYVTTLHLDNNHLTEFPNILSQYTSLGYLYLDNNQIHTVKEEDIQLSSRIESLSLNNNMLTRIPTAFNRLSVLSTLFLSNNKIESIEGNDLVDLKSLTSLNLQNNPILYISSHTFQTNTQLNYIDLSSTKLNSIPAALMSLHSLITLQLTGNTIACTCKMAYLKSWDVNSIIMFSQCESNTQTVKDYIIHSLSQCT